MNNIRPSHIEIDLGALKNNIAIVRRWIGSDSKLMAVVKADAYGHGAINVSRVAETEGVDFLGVAFLEEAFELQEAGIKTPIVILYPEDDERSAEAARRGISLTVTDADQPARIRSIINKSEIAMSYFIKVESGMHRYGMAADKAVTVVDSRQDESAEHVMGITTNLADPMIRSALMAQRQIDNFMSVMDGIKRYSRNGLYYSIDSSGSVWKNRESKGTLARIGHLLYGLVPNGGKNEQLTPVMTVKSVISEVHDLLPGDGVGYGFSFIASRRSRIATIPMGYADGYPWALSNKGYVLVNEKTAPIVGRVCMDAFMVDVTDIPGCAVGDEIVVLGKMGNQQIDAHMLGQWSGSFSYEILSGWSRRLPRIYR